MKQIQVTVPAGEGNELVKSLDEVVSPSQITHVKGSDFSLIIITVSPNRTGIVLDHLIELGIGRVKGRISIADIDATIPRLRPRKQDRFLGRISIEELEENVSSLTKMNFNFISWIILSSILAALGLVTDDNVTLIASMIIAPLMGPLVALAFGAVTSNQKILREGVLTASVGILITVVIGILVGAFYRFTLDEPSAFIIARGEPNIVNLVIAIASGLAAGICFVSGTSLALVGVAAAAALMPVSVNTGIALVLAEWQIALGSLVLFITNVVCVILGCMVVFWIRKVEPPQAVKKVKARRTLRNQIIAFVLVLLIVAFPIIQTSVQIIRKWRYQTFANEAMNDFIRPLDGVLYPPEVVDVIIGGGIFGGYTVDITIRILSTKELPNSTYTTLEIAIEGRAHHDIRNLKLEVVIIQSFDTSITTRYSLHYFNVPQLNLQNFWTS
ncbi:MAG: TIGR00341 family protein [Candidatus Heimdallarchaeota archaeon]|nr:TIGR00341 family protein [Candidatus Heimdallarchaeota archaeon]MBY8995950.1 TIGR00341 family protein [Candidatus Heimdallarchaeota archaeon]